MRTREVVAKETPSEFSLEEMFFSTTDHKGVIKSGNSVFVRVSGFTAEELIGEPHNIIRHPDMPRTVFRLLWKTIAAGEPIVAYVKNMAKDGRYYWVVAFVMPVEGGYLSIRFKPSSPLLSQVEALYARMRTAEREHGDGGEAGRHGMDAAEKILGEALQSLGFRSYEQFMWALMRTEMKSREAGLRGRAPVAVTGTVTERQAQRLQAILAASEQAQAQIDRLYHRLDDLSALSGNLMEKASFVTDMTRDIRFVALSTSIKASKLGDSGNSLGIIASFLSDSSSRTAGDVQRLSGRIRDVSSELDEAAFHLAGARLQIEMVVVFCRELLGQSRGETNRGDSRGRMIAGLERAFAATTARATRLLDSLGRHLHELNFEAEDLRKTMLMLQVAQVCGKVESSRIQADLSVAAIFEEVRAQVGKTSSHLGELGQITEQFSRLIRESPEIEKEVRVAVLDIERQIEALDAGGDEEPVRPESTGRSPEIAAEEDPALEPELARAG